MKALLEETSTQKHAPVFHHCLKISRDDDDIRASFQHLCLDGEFFDLLSVETKITKNRVFLVIFKHKDAPLPPLPSTPAPRLPSLVCADSQPASSGSLSPWKQGWERDWWWEQQSPVNHVCSCVHQTDTHRERDYTSTVLFCWGFFQHFVLFYSVTEKDRRPSELMRQTDDNKKHNFRHWSMVRAVTCREWNPFLVTLIFSHVEIEQLSLRRQEVSIWKLGSISHCLWYLVKVRIYKCTQAEWIIYRISYQRKLKKNHSCHEQMLSWSVEKLLSEMRTRLWWCCCKYVTETGPHVNQSLLL